MAIPRRAAIAGIAAGLSLIACVFGSAVANHPTAVAPAAATTPPAAKPWRLSEALGSPTWLAFGLQVGVHELVSVVTRGSVE